MNISLGEHKGLGNGLATHEETPKAPWEFLAPQIQHWTQSQACIERAGSSSKVGPGEMGEQVASHLWLSEEWCRLRDVKVAG